MGARRGGGWEREGEEDGSEKGRRMGVRRGGGTGCVKYGQEWEGRQEEITAYDSLAVV